jgi:anti-sigma regulatory factor (Ser/Thr protein kinase)
LAGSALGREREAQSWKQRLVMTTHVKPLGTESPGSGIVRIIGRYRLPSDVVSELKAALAENPLVVILDMDGIAGSSRALFDVLEPVAAYLAAWPGTVVVVCAPDPATAAHHLPLPIIDRVVLSRSWEEGLERAHHILPHQPRTTTFLPPHSQSAEHGRVFTRRTLRDWGLTEVTWPAALVVSELVTHSIAHADTVLDLTLSRADQRLRIAVHDHGSDNLRSKQLAEPTDPLEDPLRHRGLLVVRELTLGWGVFSSRDQGKTVWAIMDTT